MNNEEKMNILSKTTCLIIDGESDKAISLLDSLLKKDRNDIEIIFRKAVIYYRIDLNLDGALNELDNILKIDSKNIDALLLKGEILAGIHEHEESIKIFNQIHPKILPYCYKKFIDYLIEFNNKTSIFFNVFEFDFHFEYVFVESDIFKRFCEAYLDDLKNRVINRRLVWKSLGNSLETEAIYERSFNEYGSQEPVEEKINIISGIRLSDEEPENEEINIENVEYCIVCGKKLIKNQKKLCRSCFRKQYASRIIKKLVTAVQPQISFKKQDLKSLNLDDIQIQDYIWTLQEFDLIEVDNEKLMLKDKDTLNQFRIDSKMEPIDFDSFDKENLLNKTCKVCGKTLAISNFYKSSEGYEDVCKICKKLIVTAKYLEDIIEYVGFGNEFDLDNLKDYIPNQNQIMGMIWSLQDNDLLIEKESQIYYLADKSKCLNFLGKYNPDYELKEKDIIIKPKIKTKSKPQSKCAEGLDKSSILHEFDVMDTRRIKSLTDTQKQMSVVLKARRDGKTREEAANVADIPLYRINHWYKEGKQGFGDDNIKFYKELKEIEDELLNSANSNERKQMNFVLKLLRKGKSNEEISKFTEINESTFTSWYNQGKENRNENTVYFYNEVQKIKNDKIKKDNEKIKANNLKVQIKEFIPKFKALLHKMCEVDANCQELDDMITEIRLNIEILESASRLRRIDKLNDALSNAKKSYNALNNRLDELIKQGNSTELFRYLYSITGSYNLKSSFIAYLGSKNLAIVEGMRIRRIIVNEIENGVLKTTDDVQLRLDELIKEKQLENSNYQLYEYLYSITGTNDLSLKASFISYLKSKDLVIADGKQIRKIIVNEIENDVLKTTDDVQLRLDELIKEKQLENSNYQLYEYLYSITGTNDLSLKDSFISYLKSKDLVIADGKQIRKIIVNEIENDVLKTTDDVQLRLDELIKEKQSEHTDELLTFLYSITGSNDYSLKDSFSSNLEAHGLYISQGREIRNIVKYEIDEHVLKTTDDVQLRLDELIKEKQANHTEELLKFLYSLTGDTNIKSSFYEEFSTYNLDDVDIKKIRDEIINEIKSFDLKKSYEIRLRITELIEQRKQEKLYEFKCELTEILGKNNLSESFLTKLSDNGLNEINGRYIKQVLENKINNCDIKNKDNLNKEINNLIDDEVNRQNKAVDKLNELFREDDGCLKGLSPEEKQELKNQVEESIKENRFGENEVYLELKKASGVFKENNKSSGGLLSRLKNLFS